MDDSKSKDMKAFNDSVTFSASMNDSIRLAGSLEVSQILPCLSALSSIRYSKWFNAIKI